MTRLEVEDAIGIGDFAADEVDNAPGMGVGGVFALEDGFKVFGDHCGSSSSSSRGVLIGSGGGGGGGGGERRRKE